MYERLERLSYRPSTEMYGCGREEPLIDGELLCSGSGVRTLHVHDKRKTPAPDALASLACREPHTFLKHLSCAWVRGSHTLGFRLPIELFRTTSLLPKTIQVRGYAHEKN